MIVLPVRYLKKALNAIRKGRHGKFHMIALNSYLIWYFLSLYMGFCLGMEEIRFAKK